MREVKFRVWNTKKEIMQNKSALAFNKNGVILYDYEQLMQYSGLNDKNGIEIYKSDLLKDDKDRIFKVIEDNRIGATGYIMECVKNKSEKDHIKVGNIYNFYSWITPFNCLERIGNIYENPELLN